MKAFAIIGSAWGDEGKGAAVDALAAVSPGSLVVRFNGGAQAGHTVCSPDYRRHVFSHFCSGALAGAPGYLSEQFVVNARIFGIERRQLEALGGANLSLSIHPKALVTTPLDVNINRAMENRRGDRRHGSVGIGFGETIERSERGFPLYVGDIDNETYFKSEVQKVMDYWLPKRLRELGLSMEEVDWVGIDWEKYYQECAYLARYTQFSTIENIARYLQVVIFEGAQGLLLDQKRGMRFPHVTRSNTGLQNVIPLLDRLGIEELEAIYTMRPYLTRHGAGPLPGETTKIPFNVFDNTNKTGPWQGDFRLAPMDADLINAAIKTDLDDVGTIKVNPHVGISCLDQVRNRKTLNKLAEIKYPRALMGHGPRRDQYMLMRKFRPTTIIQLYGSSKEAEKV